MKIQAIKQPELFDEDIVRSLTSERDDLWTEEQKSIFFNALEAG